MIIEIMGMDSVELVMAIEEEFGVDFASDDLAEIFTVGQTYDFLRKALGSTPPAHCITQRIFYRVRRALTLTPPVSHLSLPLPFSTAQQYQSHRF